ncbi:MAG TPA: HEAT repeat domain-containing protein [Pyrinomonadaceae bacterium]|nr:HEAT repeat domain-containing protein [Pyrinomonadaceae bacterium]
MMHLFNWNYLKYAVIAAVTLGAMLAITIYTPTAHGSDQELKKLSNFVQGTKTNTAAMQIFREGRDFIEAQNWQKAAEKFRDFISGYPKDKDLDAALYWYAYALHKQGSKDDAVKPLLRLIENYPGSSWRREADALLVVLGRQDKVNDIQSRENCELKILALQSLFQADEERAITFVTEVLKTSPQQCPGLQSAAVSLLGSHGGARAVPMLLEIARSNPDVKLRQAAIRRLGDQHTDTVADELIKLYDADRTKEIRAQILRSLVESRSARGTAKVIEVARSGEDIALRAYALRFMAELKDANSLDELIRIYDADKTLEIRAQIIRVLAERDDPKAKAKLLDIARQGETPELRMEAIRRLSDNRRLSIDDLFGFYNTEADVRLKQAYLRAFADSQDPRAETKLFDIARGNDALDLRMYALRRLGDKDDEQTTTQLVAMYDTEQNQQVRMVLLRGFGNSKHKVAVRKLMVIAKNDPSVEMRKVAVRYLGESKDPEALKFLEDILK